MLLLRKELYQSDLSVGKVGILIHLGEAGRPLGPGDVGDDMEVLGAALGHAVVGNLGHVDLVSDGLETVVFIKLDLIVHHPRR